MQPTTLVPRLIASAGLRAAEGQSRRKIGMQHPECTNRESVSEHPIAQQSISTILSRTETVSMLHARVPAGDRALPRAEMELYTRLAQDVAPPTIVIATDHEYGESHISKFHQCGNHPHRAPRHAGPPLDPDLHELAS